MSTQKLWTPSFFLICFASLSMAMSFNVLMPVMPFFLREHFGMSGGMIGAAIAVYVLGSLFSRPLTGYAIDRWGRKGIFLATFFVFALTALAYPFLKTMAGLFALRFFHGIFWGSVLTGGQTVAVDITPKERRGEGIGFFTFAMALAMALGPAVGIEIFERWNASAVFYSSMAVASLGAIGVCYIRYKPHTPRPMPLVWRNFFDIRVLPVAIAALMFTLAYGGLANFIAVYVEQAENSAFDTAMFYIMLAIGTSISRLVGGKVFDRNGPRKVAFYGYALVMVGFLCLWATAFAMPNAARMFLFLAGAFITGMGGGFCMPVFQAMVSLMVPMSRQGVGNATYATVFELGIASGIALTGLLSEYLTFPTIYLISGLWMIPSALYFFRSVSGRYERARKAVVEI